MKLDATYSVTDTRETPISGLVQLSPVAGGLLVFIGGNAYETLTWDDDNPDAFIDDEEAGTIVVVTKEGSLLFTEEPGRA